MKTCFRCQGLFTGPDRYGLYLRFLCHVCDRRDYLWRWTDGSRAHWSGVAGWLRNWMALQPSIFKQTMTPA